MNTRSFIASIRRSTWLAAVLLLAAPFAHAEADAPSRVARLSYFDGNVTFAPAGSDEWAYAYLNRPLTTGDRVWVDQGGRSELHIGSTGLRLGNQTSLNILALDDNDTQLNVTQGTLAVHTRALLQGESFEIDTPNLALVLQSPGDYRVDVDPNSDVTTLTVRGGSAVAYGDGDSSFAVNARQQISFSGTNLTQASAATAPPSDGFDRWVADRNRREDGSVSARYVSRETIGYEELDSNGTWRDEPGYGAVWVPTVTVANWAPYHYGHWAWVAPWGWTWVDDARWGFAPFHYGRWAHVRQTWCWVPGPIVVRPVYAPALVAFVGGGSGGSRWGVSLTAGSPGVAWFPLAPGEAYRPAYVSSPTYINNINKTVIVNKSVNITNITNNVNKTVYVNQQVPGAVMAVPAKAFVGGERVQKVAVAVQPRQFANTQVMSAPALAPVKQSVLGAAAPAKMAPPEKAFERRVVATKAAAAPPAFRDTLAQKFAAENGTAPGAGQPFVPAADKNPRVAPNVSLVGGPRGAKPAANAPTNVPPNAADRGRDAQRNGTAVPGGAAGAGANQTPRDVGRGAPVDAAKPPAGPGREATTATPAAPNAAPGSNAPRADTQPADRRNAPGGRDAAAGAPGTPGAPVRNNGVPRPPEQATEAARPSPPTRRDANPDQQAPVRAPSRPQPPDQAGANAGAARQTQPQPDANAVRQAPVPTPGRSRPPEAAPAPNANAEGRAPHAPRVQREPAVNGAGGNSPPREQRAAPPQPPAANPQVHAPQPPAANPQMHAPQPPAANPQVRAAPPQSPAANPQVHAPQQPRPPDARANNPPAPQQGGEPRNRGEERRKPEERRGE